VGCSRNCRTCGQDSVCRS